MNKIDNILLNLIVYLGMFVLLYLPIVYTHPIKTNLNFVNTLRMLKQLKTIKRKKTYLKYRKFRYRYINIFIKTIIVHKNNLSILHIYEINYYFLSTFLVIKTIKTFKTTNHNKLNNNFVYHFGVSRTNKG